MNVRRRNGSGGLRLSAILTEAVYVAMLELIYLKRSLCNLVLSVLIGEELMTSATVPISDITCRGTGGRICGVVGERVLMPGLYVRYYERIRREVSGLKLSVLLTTLFYYAKLLKQLVGRALIGYEHNEERIGIGARGNLKQYLVLGHAVIIGSCAVGIREYDVIGYDDPVLFIIWTIYEFTDVNLGYAHRVILKSAAGILDLNGAAALYGLLEDIGEDGCGSLNAPLKLRSEARVRRIYGIVIEERIKLVAVLYLERLEYCGVGACLGRLVYAVCSINHYNVAEGEALVSLEIYLVNHALAIIKARCVPGDIGILEGGLEHREGDSLL